MMKQIATLGQAVGAFVSPEPRLHGLGLVTDDQDWPGDDSVEVTFETIGMFTLDEGSTNFRLRITADVRLLSVLWIDVSVRYTAPQSYSIAKSAFLEFANRVAAPLLRTQAQNLLDPLLVAAGLPPHLLPVALESDSALFRGTRLPDLLSPEVMLNLRTLPDLAAPDYPPTT